MLHALLFSVNSLANADSAGSQVSFDVPSMWHSMGPFAKGVVGCLAVMSIYSLAVVAERLVAYGRASRASRRFAEELRVLLPQGNYAEALRVASRLRNGHVVAVLSVAIEEYERVFRVGDQGHAARPDYDVIEAVHRAIERHATRTTANLRRGLNALATIGSTAPFVGLLGTVAGIITAFQSMAATGSGGLGSVSAGIAEALVTTAFGLLVAIPAVMMFNYLTGRVEDMQVDIDDSAAELVDHFIKQGPPETGSP